MKFVRKIREKKTDETLEINPDPKYLSPQQLNEAETYLIKDAQKDLHNQKKRGELTTLIHLQIQKELYESVEEQTKLQYPTSQSTPRCYPMPVGYPSLLPASHAVLVTMESQPQQRKFDETSG